MVKLPGALIGFGGRTTGIFEIVVLTACFVVDFVVVFIAFLLVDLLIDFVLIDFVDLVVDLAADFEVALEDTLKVVLKLLDGLEVVVLVVVAASTEPNDTNNPRVAAKNAKGFMICE